MIRLDGIQIDGNFVFCNFYPENCKNGGKLKVDLTTKEITEISYPNGNCSKIYSSAARAKLVEICSNGNAIPEEIFVILF